MRGKLAKKIRKINRHQWIEYVEAVSGWPFTARWRLCWHILFKKKKRKKKGQ